VPASLKLLSSKPSPKVKQDKGKNKTTLRLAQNHKDIS
jgi:hypothetical protein